MIHPFQVFVGRDGSLNMVGGHVVSLNAAGSVDFATASGGSLLELGIPTSGYRVAFGLGAIAVSGQPSGWVDVTADMVTGSLSLGRYTVTDPVLGVYGSPAGWIGNFNVSAAADISDATGTQVAVAASGSAVLASTSYGAATYNGGAAFHIYAPQTVPPYPPQDLWLTADLTTATLGKWIRTGVFEWQDAGLTGWNIQLDPAGTGVATMFNPTGQAVADRPADASKAQDATGLYTATALGAGTYGTATPTTAGAITDGSFPDQDYVLSGTVGSVQTWTGAADSAKSIQLNTSTGVAQLRDTAGIVAVRAINNAASIDGRYDANAAGKAAYGQGGEPWAYIIETTGDDPFVIDAGSTAAIPLAGVIYVTLDLNGSNEVTALHGPFFASALPANSSSHVSIPIASSDGSGGIVQIQAGAILWRP